MECAPILALVAFLTGLGIVVVTAIRNADKD